MEPTTETSKVGSDTLRCSFGYELLAEESDGKKVIRGYAVKWSDVGDRWGDGTQLIKVKKGAFKDTLKTEGREVAFLQEHEGPALASTQNGSLRLKQDRTGLAYTAKLNTDITDAADAYHRVKDGMVTGISIGFTFKFNDVQVMDDDEGEPQGYIYKRIDNLFEISLVHSPVFKDTDAVARNAARKAVEFNASKQVDGETLARVARAQLGLRQRRLPVA